MGGLCLRRALCPGRALPRWLCCPLSPLQFVQGALMAGSSLWMDVAQIPIW